MKDKIQHTPTPWAIDPANNGSRDYAYRNPTSDSNGMGFRITSLIDEDGHGISSEQDLIDLDFIVRAVNSHDALIEIAKLCLDYADHMGSTVNDKWICANDCNGCMIEKVLIRAEGGK